MALNLHNIKKWYRMLTGKSVLHVNQDLGKCFVPGKLQGYFNNLTEKVTKEPALLHSDALPQVRTEGGELVYFPVAVFQYGLGAWDLYLQTQDAVYLEKARQCADWALEHQEASGAWNNFFFHYPEHPYGAMCQGEGVSLLARMWQHSADMRYFQAAARALEFMLKPVQDGGTALYQDGAVQLLEYTHRPAVLNGWIFALFGLYDWTLVCDQPEYGQLLEQTVVALEKSLAQFDNGYWSVYDLEGRIASPFYHNLHIAQMTALHLATQRPAFRVYAKRFEAYRGKKINSVRAFVKKAVQKLLEK